MATLPADVLLVIEVADTSLAFDLGVRVQLYASMTTLFRRHLGTTPAAMGRDAGSEHFPNNRQT